MGRVYSGTTVEVIDVNDPSKSCQNLASLPDDMPVEYGWHPRGGFVDGKLILCSSASSKPCYHTEDGKSWTKTADLALKRELAAGVVIDGDSDKLFIIGGSNNPGTEFISADGTVSVGPNIYGENDVVAGNCAVALENGEILILGGFGNSGNSASFKGDAATKKVVRFNPTTNAVTIQGDMAEKFNKGSCTQKLYRRRPLLT